MILLSFLILFTWVTYMAVTWLRDIERMPVLAGYVGIVAAGIIFIIVKCVVLQQSISFGGATLDIMPIEPSNYQICSNIKENNNG